MKAEFHAISEEEGNMPRLAEVHFEELEKAVERSITISRVYEPELISAVVPLTLPTKEVATPIEYYARGSQWSGATSEFEKVVDWADQARAAIALSSSRDFDYVVKFGFDHRAT